MKSNWSEFPLGEITELVIDYRGKTPKKLGGDWSESGYRALSAKNIKTGRIVQPDTIRYIDEEMYRKWMKDEVQRGDILITSEAPFGQILYWDSDEKIVLSQRLFCLRIKSECDARFIYYYMTTPAFQGELDGRATGTTVVGLRQPELMKCVVRCPNLQEQKAIAAILSAIDAKIATNEQINNNLQQQAFALFENMFEGLFPSNYGKVGDHIIPKRGKTLLSKNAIAGDVPVVAGGLEPSTYHNVANTVPPVITISASGANAGFVNLWNIPVWSSDSTFIDATMTESVYFWFTLLKKRQQEIYDAQTGSAQPHIYPQHIADLSLGEVSPLKITQFQNMVSPLFAAIGSNKIENERLANLRDTLLPKLMSGELDVSSISI